MLVMLRSLRKQRVWEDFDIRARMWPAWFDLAWIRAADKFDMRARTARVASWVRNIETYCLFYDSASARARLVFDDALNTMSFQCPHVEIVANTQVFE